MKVLYIWTISFQPVGIILLEFNLLMIDFQTQNYRDFCFGKMSEMID